MDINLIIRKNIKFENNTLVRCGTYKDSWGSSLAAIDISQNVKNVSFVNTKIYDAWAQEWNSFKWTTYNG